MIFHKIDVFFCKYRVTKAFYKEWISESVLKTFSKG